MAKKTQKEPKAGKRDRPVKQVETIIDPDAIDNPYEMHRRRMADKRNRRPAMTRELFEQIIAEMRDGDFPTVICDRPDMPRYSALRVALAGDPKWAGEYAEAYTALADIVLEDARRFAAEASRTGNIDQQRIADTYTKSIGYTLEKLAPKTHGVLVKHAGADGGAVKVSVINYAELAKQRTQTESHE